MVPRVLHQLWIGPLPAPVGLFDSWRAAHPEPSWEHRIWSETDLDDPELLGWRPGARALYEKYLAKQIFPGAADVARVEILRHYGGIWLDADTECLHPLDGAAFLDAGFFISGSPHRPGRTQNSVMGCAPAHRVIEAYSRALETVTVRWPVWKHVGSGLLERLLAADPDLADDVLLVPSPAFQPRRADGRENPELATYTGVVYADHRFGTTTRRRRMKQNEPGRTTTASTSTNSTSSASRNKEGFS